MSRRVGVYFNFIFFLFTSTTRWDELNAWLWCPWNTLPKLWKSWFLSQMFRLSGWANMVTKKICIKINNAWFFFCTLTVVGINLIKNLCFPSYIGLLPLMHSQMCVLILWLQGIWLVLQMKTANISCLI